MPEIIRARPKDIYMDVAFSLGEFIKLKRAMDMCEVKGDMSIPENKEAAEYF